MELVLISCRTEDWSKVMTAEDAKKFVELFPKNAFGTAPIKVVSYDEAVESWDKFIEGL